MGKGRKRKYSQPKDTPLYVKLTKDGRLSLKVKALESQLSESELIEQFARLPWVPRQDLETISSLLKIFRIFLVEELIKKPDEEGILSLLMQINQIIGKIK